MKKILLFTSILVGVLFFNGVLAIHNNNVVIWLTIDPTCQIEVPFEVYQDEWITVSTWDSSAFAFKTLSAVNFSTDTIINGGVDNSWDSRGPFDWDTNYDELGTDPNPDWDSANKNISLSFSELGNHEIWAKVTDDFGEEDQCYGVINVLTPPNEPPDKPTIPAEYEPTGIIFSGECSYIKTIPAFHWEYFDPDNVPEGTEDPQTEYQIRIGDEDADFEEEEDGTPVVDSNEFVCVDDPRTVCPIESSPSVSFSPKSSDWISWSDYDQTYYWTVRVKDSNNTWSDWLDPISFNSLLHTYPEPDFTHEPESPAKEEEVSFEDESICYDSKNKSYYCSTDEGNRYIWNFGDGTICDSNDSSSCRGEVVHSYSESLEYIVTLQVIDNVGTCSTQGDTPINTISSLPEYREVPATMFIQKILANIVNFFVGLF